MLKQKLGRSLRSGSLGALLLAGLGLTTFVGLAREEAVAVEVAAAAHGSSKAEAEAYRDGSANVDAATVAKGHDVYQQVCSGCHEAGVNRAPQRFLLSQMTPESIHRALTDGVMQVQASELSADQKVAVAEYITKRKLGSGEAATPPKMCEGTAAQFDRNETPAFSGWGMDPASTHSVADNVAGITRKNVGKLKLKWALGFPNALRARSQAIVAGGAVYVGSHNGTVYALDQKTGCARWTFAASAEVRTGIVVSPWTKGDANANPLLFFGDLVGNAYAVEAFTGKLVWRQKMDEHQSVTLTGTPSLYRDTLLIPVSSLEEAGAANPNYPCCTFRGSLVAVDSRTGAEKWRTYFVEEPKERGKSSHGTPQFGPSGNPIWNSPAIDEKRNQIYVATGDNYSTPADHMSDAIVALDLDTGKIKWHYQALANDAWNVACSEANKANCPDEDGPDFDFGAGVVLGKGKDGRDYVMAGQKSSIAYGLDPDTGKLVWKNAVGRGGVVGGIHFGMASSKGRLFVPVSDVPDGKTYDIPANPGLFALDIATGKFVWKAPSANVCGDRAYCHPGYSGAITATDQLVFAGSNDGWLRAYDAATGKVLWQDDTVRPVKTVNGTTAHGGSMGGGAGPIVYRGMVFMSSGYGFAGKMPGNVLLAYEVE